MPEQHQLHFQLRARNTLRQSMRPQQARRLSFQIDTRQAKLLIQDVNHSIDPLQDWHLLNVALL